VVTKGVTLGRGVLLAANSVATRSIPDFAVAAGTPARILDEKSRFDIDKSIGSPVREIARHTHVPLVRTRKGAKSSRS
jgi:serine acetyltransferase